MELEALYMNLEMMRKQKLIDLRILKCIKIFVR